MYSCLWVDTPKRHACRDGLLQGEGVYQVTFHFIEGKVELKESLKHSIVGVKLTKLSRGIVIALLEVCHAQICTLLILIVRVLNINEINLRQNVFDVLFLLFGWTFFLSRSRL